MAVLIGAVKKVNFGNLGSSAASKRAWIISNYIAGSGYSGVSLGEIEKYLKRQMNEKITKEKIYTSLRILWNKKGIVFKDAKNWRDTIVFESKRFCKNCG